MRSTLKIFLCIVSFCISGVSFAQNLSDETIGFYPEKIIAKLKSKGIAEPEIRAEIAQARERYAEMYVKDQARRESELKRNAKIRATDSNANRSTMVDPDEKAALIALYNQAGGSGWTNHQGWDPSGATDVTTWNQSNGTGWYGIVVENGHVVTIRMRTNNMIGTVPDLSDLPWLEEFDIQHNPQVAGTTDLFQTLSALWYLDIADTKFTGTLTPIVGLTNLVVFQAAKSSYGGGLTGSIPSTISNLAALKILSLNEGFLTGSTANIGSVPSLETLYLRANNFTDTGFPSSFSNLVNLRTLSCQSMGWSTNLSLVGTFFPQLVYFDITGNDFSGVLPSSFSNLTQLSHVFLSSNNFTNVNSICGLTSLRDIRLENNDVVGFPAFTTQTLAYAIWLSYNPFGGTIHNNWQNLTALTALRASYCNLTGNIPSTLAQLPQLSYLQLNSNELEGVIPTLADQGPYMLHIQNNKFRFIDFINDFQHYKDNSPAGNFMYGPQAKTDSAVTTSEMAGNSVTFTMCQDNRYVHNHSTYPDDTFQWYKNGAIISGATGRTYTINSLLPTDAGTYHCLSKHNTTPNMSVLTLERHPIQLVVTEMPTLGACPEGFEGEVFPPTGWVVTGNGVGTQEAWEASTNPNFVCQGTKGAYIGRENISAGNTSEDWLMSPKVTVPPNGQLRFFTKQQIIGNNGTTQFQVLIAPTIHPQSDPNSYTMVASFSELELPQSPCGERTVDLSAFAGMDIYIAFLRKHTQPTASINGDGWVVDNVRVVSNCGDVTGIGVSNVQQNSLSLSWISTGAPSYQIEYGLDPLTPGTGTIINTSSNPQPITGLTAGSHYNFYVTSMCNSCNNGYPGLTAGPFHVYTVSQNFCPAPTNLVVTNYSNGATATLGWTETGAATTWEIAVSTYTPGGIGTNPVYITTTQNPYNITGLQSDSLYNFSVRAKCSNSDSDWTTIYAGGPVDTDCTKKEPEFAQNVKHLFIDMVNELLTIVNGGGTVPNGYTSPAVVAMQPYITDPNAKIYNFSWVGGVVSFSFAQHAGTARKDVIIHKYGPTYGLLTDFDLSYFISPNFFMDRAWAEFDTTSSSISIKHVRFCDSEIEPCTKNNPKSEQVTQLFIQLLNHLHDMAVAGTPVPDGYNCPQLMALAPYILDPNPRIYNFVGYPFSFSFHQPVENEDPKYDVYIGDWALDPGVNVSAIDITPFSDPTVFTLLDGLIGFSNGKKSGKSGVRHINFCPDDEGNDCPNPIVKQLYLNLLNHLHQMAANGNAIPDGYNCPELDALRPYITDADARIYNFDDAPFMFSFHPIGKDEEQKYDVLIKEWPTGAGTDLVDIDLSAFLEPTTFTVANGTMADGHILERTKVRHVNFCPDTDCTMMPVINQLFVNLLNHLREVAMGNGGSVPDGYTCPELTALAPYITDPNPRIYNFIVDPFSFSFHPVGEEKPRYDVYIEKWDIGLASIASINLANYTGPEAFTSLNNMVTLSNGNVLEKARVRHINFCPDSDGDCSMMPMINQLFVDLLNHLREVAAGNGNSIPDGYNCPQLIALAPYITDPNPRIYNFDPNPFSFSFHPATEEQQPRYDVWIEKWDFLAVGIASINLANYTTPYEFTNLDEMITLSNGSVLKEKAKVRHINFCPDSDSNCSNMPMINQLFINLLNHLHDYATNNGTVPDGYDCSQLAALRPYLSDADALIYNFVPKPFSFSFHPIGKENPKYDVFIDKWDSYPAPPIATVNLANYTTPYEFTNLDEMITLVDGSVLGKASVRHVIFCTPTTTIDCEIKPRVAELLKNLLAHLHKKVANGDADDIIDGYDCAELGALRPYLTDPNALIYNFNVQPFSFSFHPVQENESPQYDFMLDHWDFDQPNSEVANIDMSNYAGPDVFTNLNFKVTLANGTVIERGAVRHINFCPEQVNYCITFNPRAAMVRNLFIALMNHLHTMAINGTPVPDGYTCPQLTSLAPYITDPEPKIYNFMPNEFSFSFHQPAPGEPQDVGAEAWSSVNSNVASIDMSNYQSPVFFTDLDQKITLVNASVINKARVRHINFCPEDLCVNHVAIVVDESGSLTELEKTKIRRQLKKFVQQQAAVNQATNGNMHISLIGMSDSDNNTRTDNNLIGVKISQANVGQFETWINNYGNRYGEPGITQGSDFWNSGLKLALDAPRKPDMVIMITDGCQTDQVSTLRGTMSRFNNANGNHNNAAPHLYVIGIGEGFYVHDSNIQDAERMTAAIGTKNLGRLNDPNYNPSLTPQSNNADEGNLTGSLKLSLKYLFGLGNLDFPTESLNDFRQDYFAHESFLLIGEDHYYISDRIIVAGISCGTRSPQDPCDDCFSFQPEPGKSYMLSAWAKEELRTQVTTYPNPSIKITFLNDLELPFASVDATTVGDIIEGWQRIVKVIDVPANTHYIDIELKNASGTIPVFFDDIRMYPVKGTMKSFVYDPETFRLMSELDENNYATYYEYDKEGGLIRIKKETVDGVKTIQETRSGNYLKQD